MLWGEGRGLVLYIPCAAVSTMFKCTAVPLQEKQPRRREVSALPQPFILSPSAHSKWHVPEPLSDGGVLDLLWVEAVVVIS